MDYIESYFYYFLRCELDLDMNFGVGGFCMLLNFLIESGDQTSTVDKESSLFLPKPGANGYYRSDLNPSEGNGKAASDFGIWIRCLLESVFLYIYKQNSGGKLSVSDFVTSSKFVLFFLDLAFGNC